MSNQGLPTNRCQNLLSWSSLCQASITKSFKCKQFKHKKGSLPIQTKPNTISFKHMHMSTRHHQYLLFLVLTSNHRFKA
ncbi:hypothetical protein NC651_013042 [Populus alba x Populus x berolinensis]|nr:hypothetical protein NC651_013042 [Populus alba x Populus x berolinensis]